MQWTSFSLTRLLKRYERYYRCNRIWLWWSIRPKIQNKTDLDNNRPIEYYSNNHMYNTDPWGTSLKTSVHFELASLIVTLCFLQLRKPILIKNSSMTVCSYFLNQPAIGNQVEYFRKVQQDLVYTISLQYAWRDEIQCFK